MKKHILNIILGLSLILFARCNSLETAPESSITDANYWKTETHFTSFNVGLHILLRDLSFNIFLLGEPRANIYSGDKMSIINTASQGAEVFPLNTLNRENVGISNFGGFYKVINQINLMIAKTNETKVIDENSKKYLLGQAYGMRAYLYFHLLRSWGDVIIHTDYTNGAGIDLGKLNKAASSATDVMALIKSDLTNSENAFGDNYSFKQGRHYWSKAATLMLKGEVYLWSGNQMGGGTDDFKIAKAALEDIKNAPKVNLLSNFQDVFAYDKKKNNEIIFTIHNGRNESNLWSGGGFGTPDQVSGNYATYMLPDNGGILHSFFNKDGENYKNIPEGNFKGLLRLPIQHNLYKKLFLEQDTRRDASLASINSKDADGNLVYVSTFAHKFKGVILEGEDTKRNLDDYPIYRYADCLLLLAEAKAFLGEDPATEINEIRKRAYGEDVFNANIATLAYPNDKGAFYTDNIYVAGDEDPFEAILKERLRELLFEGKRWYDLRLLGTNYALKYSLAQESRLLWPIDQATLTNNRDLEQTLGY